MGTAGFFLFATQSPILSASWRPVTVRGVSHGVTTVTFKHMMRLYPTPEHQILQYKRYPFNSTDVSLGGCRSSRRSVVAGSHERDHKRGAMRQIHPGSTCITPAAKTLLCSKHSSCRFSSARRSACRVLDCSSTASQCCSRDERASSVMPFSRRTPSGRNSSDAVFRSGRASVPEPRP